MNNIENKFNNYEIVYPDYNNCILNLISSILNTYNVKTSYKSLKQISVEKLKQKKNIVFILFDGLGNEILNKYLDSDSILLKNNIDNITTVFPSTTTAVMTSIYTAKAPIEHGAIGWSLYFKEYFSLVDFLPNIDSLDRQSLQSKFINIYNNFDLKENIFKLIYEKNSKILQYNIIQKKLVNSVYNQYITIDKTIKIPYKKTKYLFKNIKNVIRSNLIDKKFIFVYSPEPDATIHKKKINSEVTENLISYINNEIEKLVYKLKGTNTSIIITADHGLVDVSRYYTINKDKDLYDSLILPTLPEKRFVNFFVKGHKKKIFEDAIKKYKKHFLILTREEFLNRKLLGEGITHPKIDDFIGDYVGIAISNKGIETKFLNKRPIRLKAHHSGLTKQEMLIPLIKIDID